MEMKDTKLNKKAKDESKKKKGRKFNKRSLKYGSNSIILTVIVVALIIVINAISGMIPLKFDLTPNKIFSISDTTKNVLKNLDMDVTIYALTDEAQLENDSNGKKVVEILNHYKTDKVEVKYIDPDKNPSIIEEISPSDATEISKGDYVVKSDKRIKVIEQSDMYSTSVDYYGGYYPYQTITGISAENMLTSAIKFVTSDDIPVIYFTTGHNEADIDDNYSLIKGYLEDNAFEVKTLNLLTEEKVPDDAALVIVASPQNDLVLDEQVKLKEYLKSGKNAIFMFDPQDKNVELKNFNEILNDYNINVNNDIIKETDKSMYAMGNQNMLMPDIPSTASSAIPGITNLGDYPLIMYRSRSISILKNENDYLNVNTIAKTSSKAISMPIAGGEGTTGTFNLAVSAEYTSGEATTRILVTGNSTFANGQYGTAGLNFMAYTLGWMIDISGDTEIPIKQYDNRLMDINELEAMLLRIVVVVVVPLIILVIGLIVWLRRRHL